MIVSCVVSMVAVRDPSVVVGYTRANREFIRGQSPEGSLL